ncbi:MAG: hypothetical protein HKN26_10095 [Acidimicrobiales bacterium]|nr:hypothetical protein [Acidimicrobiales bacterium]
MREELQPGEGGPARWGGLARKGTRNLYEDDSVEERPAGRRWDAELSPAEQAERDEKRAARAAAREQREARTAELRSEAQEAIDRSTARSRPRPKRGPKPAKRRPLPKVPLSLADSDVAIVKAVGKKRSGRLLAALEDASQAFAADRMNDARRLLKPAVDEVPDVPEVCELQGLIHYRLRNWKAASIQLERFRELTGTTEQHPVLADCYRALERWADVEELWDELKAASPSAALMVEGRIVAAGALADRGELPAALALLEDGWREPKRARPHHLRRAYALADLYERSGNMARARALFGWIDQTSSDFGDTRARLRALG